MFTNRYTNSNRFSIHNNQAIMTPHLNNFFNKDTQKYEEYKIVNNHI